MTIKSSLRGLGVSHAWDGGWYSFLQLRKALERKSKQSVSDLPGMHYVNGAVGPGFSGLGLQSLGIGIAESTP